MRKQLTGKHHLLNCSQRKKLTMAPNQRSADKRSLSIYVKKETYDRFQAACKFFGLPMTEVISSFMEQKAQEYEKSNRKRNSGKTDCKIDGE